MPTLLDDGTISITTADIRTDFPAFADTEQYPDGIINNSIGAAQCFVSNSVSGYCPIDWKCRALMLELMTCHLITLMSGAGNGSVSAVGSIAGMVVNASIGDVHVTTTVPENKSQLEWYLNQTPYGQQLNALLSTKVSPLYFGGSKQRVFNRWHR